jgi:hypothetical protein|tara:strand:+ start:198 stop:425 length:228 start_codon:yes stop_codon:yes gene_type:complete
MENLAKTIIVLQDSQERVDFWTDKINAMFKEYKETKPCSIQVTSGDYFDAMIEKAIHQGKMDVLNRLESKLSIKN